MADNHRLVISVYIANLLPFNAIAECLMVQCIMTPSGKNLGTNISQQACEAFTNQLENAVHYRNFY